MSVTKKTLKESDKLFLKRLGAKIAQERQANGLTREELAESAGLKRMQIHRIENGVQISSIIVLRSVAKALGFDLIEILKDL